MAYHQRLPIYQGKGRRRKRASSTFLAATSSRAFSNSLKVILQVKTSMLISLTMEGVCAVDHSHAMLQQHEKIKKGFIDNVPYLRAPLAFTCAISSVRLAAVHGKAVSSHIARLSHGPC